jgi:hypothetical protein
VSVPLLAAFGAAGGRPPATMESLRVLADGRARALVGSAWPEGRRQDEAGLYETTLAPDDLGVLRALVADDALRSAGGEYGPIRADSGARSIGLGEDLTIRWGAFAEPPAPVLAAAARLRELLERVREHPVAVLRLRAGDPIELSNPGSRPVRYGVQLRAGEAYDGATPIDGGPGDDVLAAGETRRIPDGRGQAVFARGALEIVVDEQPVPLDLFLVAR